MRSLWLLVFAFAATWVPGLGSRLKSRESVFFVCLTKNGNVQLSVSWRDEASKSVLWNDKPTIDDVNMGSMENSLDDSWLVAVLASIVHNNPEFIKNMITVNTGGKDNGATTDVFLFRYKSREVIKPCSLKRIPEKLGNAIAGVAPTGKMAVWPSSIEDAFKIYVHDFYDKDGLGGLVDEHMHWCNQLDSNGQLWVQTPAEFALEVIFGRTATRKELSKYSEDAVWSWLDAHATHTPMTARTRGPTDEEYHHEHTLLEAFTDDKSKAKRVRLRSPWANIGTGAEQLLGVRSGPLPKPSGDTVLSEGRGVFSIGIGDFVHFYDFVTHLDSDAPAISTS